VNGASKTIEFIARLGYGARGAVYILVSILAFAAAIGRSGQATDGKGALQALLSAPYGSVLLALVAVGLASFGIWRLLQGLLDPDRLGREIKGIAKRLVYIGSSVVHFGLALSAVRILVGYRNEASGDESVKDWTAALMAQPWGRWLTVAVGLGVAAAGLAVAVSGIRGSFPQLQHVRNRAPWVIPMGRIGFVARGIVFTIASWFLIKAAFDANAGEARGVGGALQALQEQPYGTILLAAVALGLLAFGAFEIATARFRRVHAKTIEHGSSRLMQT
jgi:hypothetical protein